MGKAVLISIQPKWCGLIAAGKKVLEIRKTRPRLDTQFKVYIYCTKGSGKNTFNVPVSYEQLVRHYEETGSMECLNSPIGNGKVIGEFICDECALLSKAHYSYVEKYACVTIEALHTYMGLEAGRELSYDDGCWGWHISGLKIYEKPKTLSEFHYPPETFCEKELCGGCPRYEMPSEYGDVMFDCEWKRPVLRAAQSWCYVEEV